MEPNLQRYYYYIFSFAMPTLMNMLNTLWHSGHLNGRDFSINRHKKAIVIIPKAYLITIDR